MSQHYIVKNDLQQHRCSTQGTQIWNKEHKQDEECVTPCGEGSVKATKRGNNNICPAVSLAGSVSQGALQLMKAASSELHLAIFWVLSVNNLL